MDAPTPPRPRESTVIVGVSACLLGHQVRFDGGHKRDRFLADRLRQYVHFLPVCPEIALGLGVPRETIRLEREGDDVRLVSRSGVDHTDAMRALARGLVDQIRDAGISGFILKAGSPTCGLERVRVYDSNDVPSKAGQGIFAAELRRALPLLPVEEEGRLNDPSLRQSFITRVFAYARIAEFLASPWTLAKLVDFHRREKLLLKTHDPIGARRLGAIVAAARGTDRDRVATEYRELFLRVLARRPSRGAHDSMLQRMLGGLRPSLDEPTHRELLAAIARFREGTAPLSTPLALIGHHSRLHGVEYLTEQTYFQPHPPGLDTALAFQGVL